MKIWKKLKECPVCGKDGCALRTTNDRMLKCFRQGLHFRTKTGEYVRGSNNKIYTQRFEKNKKKEGGIIEKELFPSKGGDEEQLKGLDDNPYLNEP